MNSPHPLELDGATMRAWVDAAMSRIVQHIETLPQQPAADTEGAAELARSLIERLPESGSAYEDVLRMLFERAIPKTFNCAGPGYMAYVPGGGIFHAALADLIANSANRFVGVWAASPGLVQIETNAVRWLCEIVGYPAGAHGLLTTGGSYANLVAIVTARRERLPEDFLSGTIYASDQMHHSLQKAAVFAGFPACRLRLVETDARFRISLDALRTLIAEDRRAGLRPFLVIGNAGTTNTGAADDLAGLAGVAREEQVWLHVDGAYGGVFTLTERGRDVLRGIEEADSITLDPHKGLFLPYGTGSLLVKDGAALRRAHGGSAQYLPPMQDDPNFVDYCELSPELSRDFRGLRVYLPIKIHGIAAFRAQLDEKLDLAFHAAERLRDMPHVRIVAEPQLSTVAFRLEVPGRDAADLDRLNHAWLDATNRRQRIHISGATVRGQYVLRICVLSFRTHRERLDQGLEDLRDAAREVLGTVAAT